MDDRMSRLRESIEANEIDIECVGDFLREHERDGVVIIAAKDIGSGRLLQVVTYGSTPEWKDAMAALRGPAEKVLQKHFNASGPLVEHDRRAQNAYKQGMEDAQGKGR